MYLDEHVASSIKQFPSLYKCGNWELSRLHVLNQLFLAIGNGYEWAHTKNTKKGGYLTEPTYYKWRGGWKRKYDLPYGRERHEILSQEYFNRTVFQLSYGNMTRTYKEKIVDVFLRDDEGGNKSLIVEFEGLAGAKVEEKLFRKNRGRGLDAKLSTRFSQRVFMQEVMCENGFVPYLVSKYSAIQEIDEGQFVQSDWLQGAIDVAQEALSYYSDEDRYKDDTYYPSDRKVKSDRVRFEKIFGDEGLDGTVRLRKLWGYSEGEEIPSEDEVMERITRCWEDSCSCAKEFYNRFLGRYV